MYLPKRINKNVSLSLAESQPLGTNGLTIMSLSKDGQNVTIKIPDLVTTVDLEELQIALDEVRDFLSNNRPRVADGLKKALEQAVPQVKDKLITPSEMLKEPMPLEGMYKLIATPLITSTTEVEPYKEVSHCDLEKELLKDAFTTHVEMEYVVAEGKGDPKFNGN